MGNASHLFVIASVKSMSVKKVVYSRYAEDRISSSKLQMTTKLKITTRSNEWTFHMISVTANTNKAQMIKGFEKTRTDYDMGFWKTAMMNSFQS